MCFFRSKGHFPQSLSYYTSYNLRILGRENHSYLINEQGISRSGCTKVQPDLEIPCSPGKFQEIPEILLTNSEDANLKIDRAILKSLMISRWKVI